MTSREQNGLTLLELMICLAILSILISIGLPSMPSSRHEHLAREQLLDLLRSARAQAIVSGKITQVSGLTIDNQPRGYIWREGFTLSSNNRGNEDITFYLPKEIFIKWKGFRNVPFIAFEPDGTTHALNGTFTLCSSSHSSGPTLVVSLSGRIRLGSNKPC